MEGKIGDSRMVHPYGDGLQLVDEFGGEWTALSLEQAAEVLAI